MADAFYEGNSSLVDPIAAIRPFPEGHPAGYGILFSSAQVLKMLRSSIECLFYTIQRTFQSIQLAIRILVAKKKGGDVPGLPESVRVLYCL